MNQGKAGDRVGGLSKRLVVLFLAMVIAGFAIPSPGIGTPGSGFGKGNGSKAYAKPSVPELLIVPDIDLEAKIIPISVDANRVLSPPEDASQVGWWRRSAKPGSLKGQTLLTGHTLHNGGGVMNRLGELRPGSAVRIRTTRSIVDYIATKVFVYTQEELAIHAEDLFNQKRTRNRLVLVTCTGWTGSEYTSNIIVFADPVGVRKLPGAKKVADEPEDPTPVVVPTKAPSTS